MSAAETTHMAASQVLAPVGQRKKKQSHKRSYAVRHHRDRSGNNKETWQ